MEENQKSSGGIFGYLGFVLPIFAFFSFLLVFLVFKQSPELIIQEDLMGFQIVRMLGGAFFMMLLPFFFVILVFVNRGKANMGKLFGAMLTCVVIGGYHLYSSRFKQITVNTEGIHIARVLLSDEQLKWDDVTQVHFEKYLRKGRGSSTRHVVVTIQANGEEYVSDMSEPLPVEWEFDELYRITDRLAGRKLEH